jgi:hypothetical protein
MSGTHRNIKGVRECLGVKSIPGRIFHHINATFNASTYSSRSNRMKSFLSNNLANILYGFSSE